MSVGFTYLKDKKNKRIYDNKTFKNRYLMEARVQDLINLETSFFGTKPLKEI